MPNYYPDKTTDNFVVAMSYVPWQHSVKIYDNLEEAYRQGTIFPELNKPFTGRRCVNGK